VRAVEVAVGDTPLDEIRFVASRTPCTWRSWRISEALLPEARRLGLTIVRGAQPPSFDGTGRVRPF